MIRQRQVSGASGDGNVIEFRDRRYPGVLTGKDKAKVPAALAAADKLMRDGSPPTDNVVVVHSPVKNL